MNCNSYLMNKPRGHRACLLPAAVAVALLFSTGCVKRVMSSRWFGLFRTPASRSAPAKARPTYQAAKGPALHSRLLPDDVLRQAFTRQASGAFDPATDDRRVQLLTTRLRLDPQDVGARLELAGIYEYYRMHDEAFDQYSRSLNLLVQAERPAARERLETAATGLARCARATARTAHVAPLLAALLRKHEGLAEVWKELGLLHDDAGNLEAAEAAFREALARSPRNERLHNHLGYTLLRQNRLEEAEGRLRRALELNPKLGAARNNLGTVLARRGDIDGARRQFLEAAAGQNDSVATAHNNLAVVLMEMGDYEQGREELVKALKARNYFPPAIENFKLVQEILRGRADLATAGGSMPLDRVRPPAALASGRFGFSAAKH